MSDRHRVHLRLRSLKSGGGFAPWTIPNGRGRVEFQVDDATDQLIHGVSAVTMMRLRQTRGEAGSHVVKLELCRTTVGFKDATIEGIGTLTFSVVSNAQRRIRNHLVHPVRLGTAEYPARLAGALRLMSGGRDTDDVHAFLAAAKADARTFADAWKAVNATNAAAVDAFFVRCARHRTDAVRRMLVDTQPTVRRLARAILGRTPPVPPWTARVIVLVAQAAARMRSSTTDADVASAAVACIACIKDEFEAAFARMKAMARALASRYTHDLLAARVAACAQRAARRQCVFRQVRCRDRIPPAVSRMREKQYTCAHCGVVCRYFRWVVGGRRRYKGRRGCGACRAVLYCGRACQVSHWKEGGHRETCERTRVPEE